MKIHDDKMIDLFELYKDAVNHEKDADSVTLFHAGFMKGSIYWTFLKKIYCKIADEHTSEPLADDVLNELDRIVAAADKVGKTLEF